MTLLWDFKPRLECVGIVDLKDQVAFPALFRTPAAQATWLAQHLSVLDQSIVTHSKPHSKIEKWERWKYTVQFIYSFHL